MPDVNEYSNSGVIFRGQIEEGVKKESQSLAIRRKLIQVIVDGAEVCTIKAKRLVIPRSMLSVQIRMLILREVNYLSGLKRKKKVYKHLEWNKYRVECRGSDIKIFLNGTLMTHVIDTKDAEGHIAIQHHGSKELNKTGKTKNMFNFAIF